MYGDLFISFHILIAIVSITVFIQSSLFMFVKCGTHLDEGEGSVTNLGFAILWGRDNIGTSCHFNRNYHIAWAKQFHIIPRPAHILFIMYGVHLALD